MSNVILMRIFCPMVTGIGQKSTKIHLSMVRLLAAGGGGFFGCRYGEGDRPCFFPRVGDAAVRGDGRGSAATVPSLSPSHVSRQFLRVPPYLNLDLNSNEETDSGGRFSGFGGLCFKQR